MIQVVTRALNILSFVAKHGEEPVTLSKIAGHVDLSHSTTAHIVATLVQENYLEQVGRREGYRLGVAGYQLGNTPSFHSKLILAARKEMEDLTLELKETSLLGVIQNNKRAAIHIENASQMLQAHTLVVADLYNTSTGRLLMAYLKPAELEKLLKVIGLPSSEIWPGAEREEGLTAALAEIRMKAFTEVSSVYHTIGFAVPVLYGDKIVAALSIFMPQSRYSSSDKEGILKSISRTSKAITRSLKSK